MSAAFELRQSSGATASAAAAAVVAATDKIRHSLRVAAVPNQLLFPHRSKLVFLH